MLPKMMVGGLIGGNNPQSVKKNLIMHSNVLQRPGGERYIHVLETLTNLLSKETLLKQLLCLGKATKQL